MKCLYRAYLATGGAIVYARADGATLDLASASDDVILALRGAELGYVSRLL